MSESARRSLPSPDAISLPLIDSAAGGGSPKPLLRGWLHLGTVPFAIACGVVLICLAQGALSKWAATIYMLTSLLLFTISALYHRINWSARVKAVFRRIDHANIFLLIAGTYTPIAIGTLPLQKAWTLLAVVWSGALLGLFFRVFWLSAPRWLYVPLYLALGWAAIFYIVDIARGNLAAMILVIVGGGLYSLGAVAYGTKWPLRSNRYFGFHEVFHSCTVAAFFCHWVAALLALLDPVYLR